MATDGLAFWSAKSLAAIILIKKNMNNSHYKDKMVPPTAYRILKKICWYW